MAFLTGTGTSLQMGKETAFAAGSDPTDLVDLTSESIKVGVEKGDEGSLLGSKTAMARDLLGISVEGSASFILRPQGAGLLLHAALGGSDVCEQVGETDGYTHTMKLCDVDEDLPSLCLVVDRKAAAKRYPGCTVASLSLECAAGDYVKGSIDIKGTREETGSPNAALPSFSIPSYRCTAATFNLRGTVHDITSATFKVDNALEAAPKTYASGLYTGQPRHGRRSVTLSFEIPYSTEVEDIKDTYLMTEADASVSLSFTSPQQGHSISITIPHLAIGEVDATVGGTGILSSTVSGEALSVGTEEPVTVVVTDQITTAYGG